MAAWRLCLFAVASLAALQSSIALPVEPDCDARDKVLLVQKGITAHAGDLHMHSSWAIALLSPFQEAMLHKVQSTLKQLPFNLPFALPFKVPANVSVEDLTFMGKEVFSTFKNKSFVAALHETLGDINEAWAEFVKTEQDAIDKLSACEGQPTATTVKELETLWRAGESGLKRFFTKAAVIGMNLVRRQPNEIKRIWAALTNASSTAVAAPNASDGSSAEHNAVQLVPENLSADVLFSDVSEMCSKFQSIWPNLTGLENSLEKAVSFLERTEQSLPEVEGLVAVLAPDVSDRVMGVVNASMSAVLNMTTSNLAVTKPAFAIMKTQLEGCLSCEMPEVAGALHGGPSIIIGLVAVVSSWLALRH